MRRLLVSVAFLAALLIVPSAALALDAPTNVAATPAATNQPLVTITWTDAPLAAIYHVRRADTACATAAPGDFNALPGADVLPGIGTYTDTMPTPNLSYCYVVRSDDL